jgi:nitrile hydratase accessory protein
LSAPDARFEAPFEEPWQAQLFALTVALAEAGHFGWAEWVARLSPRVRDTAPEAYWTAWADALVEMLEARGIAGAAEVAALARRWQDAARATPHGQPIRLT